MAKLYTRTGDDGTTGLFGGGRVPKDHLRVAAYGDVDELNAALGLAAAASSLHEQSASTQQGAGGDADARGVFSLQALQSRMFDLGADLATPHDSPHADKISRIDRADITLLERWIDAVDADNAPLTTFVLPGGCELAARLHLARTICRRAERSVIALAHVEPVNEHAVVLLNRVSDLLFALARAANRKANVDDVPWVAR